MVELNDKREINGETLYLLKGKMAAGFVRVVISEDIVVKGSLMGQRYSMFVYGGKEYKTIYIIPDDRIKFGCPLNSGEYELEKLFDLGAVA